MAVGITTKINPKGIQALGAVGAQISKALDVTENELAANIEEEAQQIAKRVVYGVPTSPNYPKRSMDYFQSITAIPKGKNAAAFIKARVKRSLKIVRVSIKRNASRVGIYVPYAVYVEEGRDPPVSFWTFARPVLGNASVKIMTNTNIANKLAKNIKDEVK